MSRLRRVWIAVQEITLLIVGSFVSLLVAVWGYVLMANPAVPLLVFAACEYLSLTMLFRLRRRHRDWKIQYDAANYEWERAWRQAFPRRSRLRRTITHIAVLLPASLAIFVLFFLPPASHLLYPTGVHLGPYKRTVPWNVLLLPWPYSSQWSRSVMAFTGDGVNPLGLTHFVRGNRLSSSIFFTLYSGAAETWKPALPPTREFQFGRNVLHCWEDDRHPGFPRISCSTAYPNGHPEFEASFVGEADRVPLFYQILGSAGP